MVGLIAALHARDYITRAPGASRALHVTLTPAGRTAYATAQRKVRALERTLTRDLPDGDYQRVTTLMHQLAETIDRLPVRARHALRHGLATTSHATMPLPRSEELQRVTHQ
jgi:hypothetical protein